tara:strand:- start:30 stop:230 length:201 start_codon:yes stop_codon:yes gene_type:complete
MTKKSLLQQILNLQKQMMVISKYSWKKCKKIFKNKKYCVFSQSLGDGNFSGQKEISLEIRKITEKY